jgi:hypothetical protein
MLTGSGMASGLHTSQTISKAQIFSNGIFSFPAYNSTLYTPVTGKRMSHVHEMPLRTRYTKFWNYQILNISFMNVTRMIQDGSCFRKQ